MTDVAIDTLDDPVDPDNMSVVKEAGFRSELREKGIAYFLRKFYKSAGIRLEGVAASHFSEQPSVVETIEHIKVQLKKLHGYMNKPSSSYSDEAKKEVFSLAMAIHRNLEWISPYVCNTIRPRSLDCAPSVLVSHGRHFMDTDFSRPFH